MPQINLPQLHVSKFPMNATCAVTTSWDDNDDTNLHISKILNSVKLKGTFYVDPGNPRAPWTTGGELTESQLQELATLHEVGSHTWSHRNLARCDFEEIRQELTKSKEYLEAVSRKPVYGLAYPRGQHSSAAERIVRDCGYLFARTVEEGNVTFPPRNPYAWGVSVHALQRPRLLSRRAHVYVKNMTGDWRKLASRLFAKAQGIKGVWHMFGHSWEILSKPTLQDDFMRICEHVGGRNDVWYATNGMLFLNEELKRRVEIATHAMKDKFVFSVRTNWKNRMCDSNPIPLKLVVPHQWTSHPRINVSTVENGRFHMGRSADAFWIDLFDCVGRVEVTRD